MSRKVKEMLLTAAVSAAAFIVGGALMYGDSKLQETLVK